MRPGTWARPGWPVPGRQRLSTTCLFPHWVGGRGSNEMGRAIWGLAPLLPIPAGDPALPACPSAAQSTWPCCGRPRPWARERSRPCLDSMMPSTSIRCVPWGRTHPPRHTSMCPCDPGHCPRVHGRANALHSPGCRCWHLGLLAHCTHSSVPCSLAQAWVESVRGGLGDSSASRPTEHLPLCAASCGGRAAAGGRGADGSCAQRPRPGEVRAVPRAGCPHMWAQHDPDWPILNPRPPGHHSQRAAANGFCVFNNVAIAAKHAQQKHGLHRCVRRPQSGRPGGGAGAGC